MSQLIASADVVVENMALGVADRLGFGYEAVQSLNPRIVYAHIRGFPSGNARSDYLSDDMVAQAVGGSIATTGYMDGPLLAPGLTLGEPGAALHAVMGIIAALHQRESTGRGQRIEVSMQEAVINLAGFTTSLRYRSASLTSGSAIPRVMPRRPAYMKADMASMAKVIKEAGIKVQ